MSRLPAKHHAKQPHWWPSGGDRHASRRINRRGADESSARSIPG